MDGTGVRMAWVACLRYNGRRGCHPGPHTTNRRVSMLRIHHLTYQYGTLVVLRDLSLHLPPGQVGLLFGENGAGKSTLLRCIAGWTRVSRGTISVNGVSCQEHERDYRRQVVFVSDTPDFYDELTAWEHLQLIAQLHRIPAWQDHAARLLQQFRLSDSQDSFPFTFSRGMRYKLALCMALLVHPPLLLLDEPFASLDALAAQTLWRTFRHYTSSGGLTVFSSHTIPSHDQPDVILHLHQGQIETLSPAEAVGLTGQLLNPPD